MMVRLLQTLGILLLLPAVAFMTLRNKHLSEDGPSLFFAGGPLVAGAMYSDREPDWSVIINTDNLELQLYNPVRSYRVLAVPVNGRLYAVAPNMSAVWRSVQGHWAEQAAAGDGTALIRVNGTRYSRRLIRIIDGDAIEAVASTLSRQYDMPTTWRSILSGNLWVFELVPRVRE